MTRALLGAVVAIWLVAPSPAHAYLDPATGSAVLQVLIGGAMGALFVVKRYWRQLKGWVTGRVGLDSEASVQETRPDREHH